MSALGLADAPRRDRPLPDELAAAFAAHRSELIAYCRRILGSAADADDAVQETLIRAWRNIDRFEHRASLRTWLYRIATNACYDAVRARGRRAEPIDLVGAAGPVDALDVTLRAAPTPEAAAESAEDVERAFTAALARLPARQRAALVLYDVFRWPARDVALMLDTSTASVTSSVQRARATLAVPADGDGAAGAEPAQGRSGRVVDDYVDAFRRYDVAALVTLDRAAS
jgi:RNA polymerase sigma-70 factor, ECF subfamily